MVGLQLLRRYWLYTCDLPPLARNPYFSSWMEALKLRRLKMSIFFRLHCSSSFTSSRVGFVCSFFDGIGSILATLIANLSYSSSVEALRLELFPSSSCVVIEQLLQRYWLNTWELQLLVRHPKSLLFLLMEIFQWRPWGYEDWTDSFRLHRFSSFPSSPVWLVCNFFDAITFIPAIFHCSLFCSSFGGGVEGGWRWRASF